MPEILILFEENRFLVDKIKIELLLTKDPT